MIKYISVLLCLVGIAVAVPLSANNQNSQEIVATVVNVDDGDSLIVSINHRAVIVDLAGVVCPPTDNKEGARAKRFTERMVMSKKVSIVPEGRTQMGRMSGRIFIGGHCLNEALIKSGLARRPEEKSALGD